MFSRDKDSRVFSAAILIGFMALSTFISFWTVYFESIALSKSQIGFIYSCNFIVGGLVIPFMQKITSRQIGRASCRERV